MNGQRHLAPSTAPSPISPNSITASSRFTSSSELGVTRGQRAIDGSTPDDGNPLRPACTGSAGFPQLLEGRPARGMSGGARRRVAPFGGCALGPAGQRREIASRSSRARWGRSSMTGCGPRDRCCSSDGMMHGRRRHSGHDGRANDLRPRAVCSQIHGRPRDRQRTRAGASPTHATAGAIDVGRLAARPEAALRRTAWLVSRTRAHYAPTESERGAACSLTRAREHGLPEPRACSSSIRDDSGATSSRAAISPTRDLKIAIEYDSYRITSESRAVRDSARRNAIAALGLHAGHRDGRRPAQSGDRRRVGDPAIRDRAA